MIYRTINYFILLAIYLWARAAGRVKRGAAEYWWACPATALKNWGRQYGAAVPVPAAVPGQASPQGMRYAHQVGPAWDPACFTVIKMQGEYRYR